jgi:hypothetical protein
MIRQPRNKFLTLALASGGLCSLALAFFRPAPATYVVAFFGSTIGVGVVYLDRRSWSEHLSEQSEHSRRDVDMSTLVEEHLRSLPPGSPSFQDALVSASAMGVHVGDRNPQPPIKPAQAVKPSFSSVTDSEPKTPAVRWSQVGTPSQRDEASRPIEVEVEAEVEAEQPIKVPDYWAAAMGATR